MEKILVCLLKNIAGAVRTIERSRVPCPPNSASSLKIVGDLKIARDGPSRRAMTDDEERFL